MLVELKLQPELKSFLYKAETMAEIFTAMWTSSTLGLFRMIYILC